MLVKSDFLVRYREFFSNGVKVKKPDDSNLMIANQFNDWPHVLEYHEDGSKIYTFEYEGINYKATHVWFEEPQEGYVADVRYENVVYDEGLDKFVVTEVVPLPEPQPSSEESSTPPV